MACCALGPCGDPTCDLCTRVARLPQPRRARDLQKRDKAELRDSKPVPDLSAPRAAAVALGRVKRSRKVFTRGNA